MNSKNVPMVEGRMQSVPKIYGNTPSFLGVPVLGRDALEGKLDVVVAGVPWEGTITWGSFSGCEFAPRTIRHASVRYGGFLPEYEIDLFDYLNIADIGDVPVDPNSPKNTMDNVFNVMRKIYQNRSLPIVFGGDHSFTPEIVRALGEEIDGDIGIIHFDSHFDNSPTFGQDEYPRCGPIYRIAQIGKVRKESIVHIGIRGPRNSPSQFEYARSIGATIYTIRDIRRLGIDAVVDEAIAIASTNTKHLFVTICSDCIDAAFNPGGPADFNGLFPNELFSALFKIGEAGISGLDYVEIYPSQDPQSFSSHFAAWAVIHVLAGIASRKRSGLSVRP